MAVQKSRKTRSKRGMRRSHDALSTNSALTIENETGETRRRHHVSALGYYRGKQVVQEKVSSVDAADHNEE